MENQTNQINQTDPTSHSATLESPTSYLAQEYRSWHELLSAQTMLVQRLLDAQARKLADAILRQSSQVRFTLPDRVVVREPEAGEQATITRDVPLEEREQMAGGIFDRFSRTDLGALLRQRLSELEASPNQAVAVSAGLVRFATARYMVHSMLPAGRTVTYKAGEDEEIPSIPELDELEAASAITATTDAIVEEGGLEEGRGELLVPYVPAARRFYLPQWVAFDDQDNLLVSSASEAEADIVSMQRYIGVLHAAVGLAPFMVSDTEYQQKRYGILGQLVNQGRALARYQTNEIIQNIKHRAATNNLNRGLSLSLPYFDDQTLQVATHNFEVIPAGRIMFVPAFVVRAALQEQVKVAQDTRLDPSTRKHLLEELQNLAEAFTE